LVKQIQSVEPAQFISRLATCHTSLAKTCHTSLAK
jgi:hypothetical protein